MKVRKKQTKIKKLFKEMGRFILSTFLFGFGDFIFLKIGCGKSIMHYSAPEHCLVCPHPSGIIFCDTNTLNIIFSIVVLFLMLFFVWKKKLSKAWLVDIIIILILFFVGNIAIDYAMQPVGDLY